MPFALRDHGLRTLVEHLAHFRASLASDYRPQKKSELDQPFSRFPVLNEQATKIFPAGKLQSNIEGATAICWRACHAFLSHLVGLA